MQLTVEPKDVSDAYSTPIVQQTSFWSRVKANLGMRSKAFEFSVRNSDLYTDVGGWSRTNADLLMFAQYCSSDEYVAYLPYGPEIEPSEENQGRFLEELSECLRSYLPKGCLATTSTGSPTGARRATSTPRATGAVVRARSSRRCT